MVQIYKLFFLICIGLSVLSCQYGSSNSISGVERGLSSALSSGARRLRNALPGGLRSSVHSNLNSRVDMTSSQYTSVDLSGVQASITSPYSYFEMLVDKTAEENPNNGMGLYQRYRQKTMQAVCAVMALTPDENADGVPDVGTHSIVIPTNIDSDLSKQCPELTIASLSNVSGETVTVSIVGSSALPNTEYDYKATMTGASGSISGVSLGEFYYRYTSDTHRFFWLEPYKSATFFEYSDLTKILKFEFISSSGSQREHFRLFYDESAGTSAFYGYEYNNTGPYYVAMTGVTNMLLQTQAAISFAAETAVDTLDDAQACVIPTSLSFLGTWSSHCSSVTGLPISRLSPPTIISGFSSYSLSTSNINQQSTIQFSSAVDLISAGFPQ